MERAFSLPDLRIALRWRLHGMMRRLAPEMLQRDRKLKLPGGIALWGPLSDTQAALLYVYGTTEFYGTRLIRSVLQPGDTVVDVGANLGEYTLLSAKCVGSAGRVLSFEPHPESYRLLSRSVAANLCENVTLFRVALSDRGGRAYISSARSANSGQARVVNEPEDGPMVEVECQTLDAIVERHRVTRVDLVKVDVEGREAAVLAGAKHLLARDRPLVFFEVNGLEQSHSGFTAPVIEILHGVGYDLYGVEPRHREWHLVRLGEGESPLRFRDRWQHHGYQPNLLAAHSDNNHTEQIILRLLGRGTASQHTR